MVYEWWNVKHHIHNGHASDPLKNVHTVSAPQECIGAIIAFICTWYSCKMRFSCRLIKSFLLIFGANFMANSPIIEYYIYA